MKIFDDFVYLGSVLRYNESFKKTIKRQVTQARKANCFHCIQKLKNFS